MNDNADTFRKRKSRFAMRFIIGLYTERISELELELGAIIDRKNKSAQQIENVRAFLSQFGFNSEKQVADEIEALQKQLLTAKKELSQMNAGYKKDTHFVDTLRNELMQLEQSIANDDKALRDVAKKICDQESLKAELVASKFKLSRFQAAKEILEGAHFEHCPSCGMQVTPTLTEENATCYLCGQSKKPAEKQMQINKIARLDLDMRLKELDESIFRQRASYDEQKRALAELRCAKKEKDDKLNELLATYDSQFLSQSRELERQTAASEERVRNLGRISEMPKAVNMLEQSLVTLRLAEENINRELLEENKKKESADHVIKELEMDYKQALLSVSLPGLNKNDAILLNRKTWIPEIIPSDKTKQKWSFENIGSAGVKTLLNVCYALVLHKVAVENNLPLPTLLIIDTPSKNIDKEVNPEIFASLYDYIYSLAVDSLSNTQFVLIDNNFFKPPETIIAIEHFMTRNDKDHPPLIRNYKSN